MARTTPEKPNRHSRLRRILDWELPGSYAIFRPDGSPLTWLIPELQHFDTPKRRSDAFGKALNQAVTRNPRYWLFLIGFMAVMALMIFLVDHMLGRHYAPFFILFEMCWGAGAAFLPLIIFQRRIRRDLRRQLFEQGRPICVPCGYDLTGNDSGRCPECGWRIGRGDGGKADPAPGGRLGGDMTESGAGVDRHGR